MVGIMLVCADRISQLPVKMVELSLSFLQLPKNSSKTAMPAVRSFMVAGLYLLTVICVGSLHVPASDDRTGVGSLHVPAHDDRTGAGSLREPAKDHCAGARLLAQKPSQ